MFTEPDVDGKNIMKQLDLFKDTDGLIWCFRRLKNADIPDMA